MSNDTNKELLGPNTRAAAEKLGLTDEQARELLATAETEREVQSSRASTRGRVLRLLLAGLLGAGAVTLAGGVGLYAAWPKIEEVMTDVAMESGQRVAERESKERIEVIQAKSQEFINLIMTKLLPALSHFMDTAKTELSDPDQIMALAARIYEGLKSDAWDYYTSDDKTPDKVIAELQAYVEGNEALNAAFMQLQSVSEEIKQWVAALPEDLKEQISFTEKDAQEAQADVRAVATEKLKEITSFPRPESPKSEGPPSSDEGTRE